MKKNPLPYALLLAACSLPAFSGPSGPAVPPGLRDAVEAHRVATRDDMRRQEAEAGRRMSPAELAELRQQVRQQSLPRQEPIPSAESQPAERMVPVPVKGAALGTPVAQPR